MRRRKKLKKGYKKVLMLLLISITLCLLVEVGYYYMTLNKELTPVYNHEEYFYASDFGINVIKSETDYDNDGIDDYSDILLGAQKERDRNPIYVSKYYDGGYPPDDEGVCTDVIWRALKEAGYYLKDMMVYDITKDQKDGTGRYDIDIRDDNIDFRRVDNQEAFLKEYTESLTNDIYDIESFMPGDIVVFDYGAHIAIISNKRNENGIPYLIQNRSEEQEEKEEDRIEKTDMSITGHYRFTYNRELKRLIKKIS